MKMNTRGSPEMKSGILASFFRRYATAAVQAGLVFFRCARWVGQAEEDRSEQAALSERSYRVDKAHDILRTR